MSKIVFSKHSYLLNSEYSVIDQELAKHSKTFYDFQPAKHFAFLAKDTTRGKIIGGCYGASFYDALHLDQISVMKEYRGNGVGSRLVKLCEELAKERNCLLMTLNTMSWEAPEFYKKLGFEQNGVIDGYANGAKRFFFSKKL